MSMLVYKATGAGLTTAIKLLGLDLRVSGSETLPDRPVLFVPNHFTRFETFLVPYVIYHRFGRGVHSLATHVLFGGQFGRYLGAIGVVSVRDPARNRKIVGELMTGRSDWVIYPEGGLVKNKRITKSGRWRRSPHARRPRTGAAVMALKSELYKQRYLEACERRDRPKRLYYERRYELHGPQDVAAGGTLVVPVSITYPHLRSGRNMLNRVAGLLRRRVDPRLDEELQVEGTLLLGGGTVSVHFGDPIEVRDFLDRPTELARRALRRFVDGDRSDVLLRRQARRLTGASMRSVYENVEINFDHLFCCGLRTARRDVVSVSHFRRALYLAAMDLRSRSDVRLHPILTNGIIALPTGNHFAPLENIERLAVNEGVVRRENGSYVIDRARLHEEHDLHEIRIKKLVQVIANEVESVDGVVDVVRSAVNADEREVGVRIHKVIRESDQRMFRREYERWAEPGLSKPIEYGEPFFLPARKPRAGIVLAHGYLACPEQMRPVAEHLRDRGFSVYGIRLDGHGTSPRQLREITWESWLDALRHARTVVSHECPRTIVGGFSLGGVLAVLLAAECGDDLDGLFTINAPMKLQHRWAPLVPAVVQADSLVRRLLPSRDHLTRVNSPEIPELSYHVDYLWGTRELQRAMKRARRCLGQVRAPALVVQADGDPVVAPESADVLMRGLGSSLKRRERVGADHHVIVRGEHAEHVAHRVGAFLDRIGERAEAT